MYSISKDYKIGYMLDFVKDLGILGQKVLTF